MTPCTPAHRRPSRHDLHWRPLAATDIDALQDFVARQSPADRRLRYHVAVRTLDRRWIERLLQATRQAAFVALAPGAGIVAEAQLGLDADGRSGELGLMVDAGWRGRGVGAWCLRRLRHEALSRGLARLRAEVLHENAGMHALLVRCGFEAQDAAEPGLCAWETPLAAPQRPPQAGWLQRLGMGAMGTLGALATGLRA